MSLACKCIDDGMHSVSCFPRVVGICWKKNPVSSSELKVCSFKSWFRGRYHKEETGKNKRREKRIPESGEYRKAEGNTKVAGACAAIREHRTRSGRLLPCRPDRAVACGPAAAAPRRVGELLKNRWRLVVEAAAARASGTPTGVRNRTGAPHASASVPTPSTEQ